jgi:two-component system, NtrC family, sensor kinase
MHQKDGRPGMVAAYLDGRRDVEDLRARLGALTAFVGGILFEVDEDGRYLAVVTGDASLLALPVERLMELTVPDVLGPELGGEFVAMFKRVSASGEAETLNYTLDVPRGRRSFLCEARPTFDALDAAKQTVTLLIRDVTEETELKAKLLEAERLAAMGLVAASIGHEIRQPLAFATTSVEVLEREMAKAGVTSATHAAREALEHVRDAIRRIAGIASNIGVVAPPHDRRDSARQHDRTAATTDIRRPIEAAVDLCASELQGRARVALTIPDLPRVRANEGELCQVVANLLLNAAQAVDPNKAGSSQINIGASLDHGEEHVRISVADDGCGIDPTNATRIFDPFFTTKEPGQGMGLGLFVSKRIVEASGGALQVESSLNSGTTVHVTLPVAIGEDMDIAPPSSLQPIISRLRRLRLLVIDDEPAFLRSLELVLEDTHEVVVCGRSADALTMLRADPKGFDAVLCDLSMPEIDGVAFYRQMESLKVADRFVLMTAGAFTPHGEEFLRQAKCKRIGKPFTYEKLVAVLNSVSTKKRADADVS